jgi:hypothetical protein
VQVELPDAGQDVRGGQRFGARHVRGGQDCGTTRHYTINLKFLVLSPGLSECANFSCFPESCAVIYLELARRMLDNTHLIDYRIC